MSSKGEWFGPCVGSGFCCKQTPCPFGRTDPETGWCAFLEVWEQTETETTRYRCGRYEEIQGHPLANFSPAFGAGCCSPMFNQDRKQITQELIELRRSR